MWFVSVLPALFFLAAPDPAADGLKALEEQRWDSAAASFTKAIEADQANYALHFNLAFAQSMLGRDADAADSYHKVLQLKPGLYEAELNLGILLLRMKQSPGEAASLLEDAVKQKPKEFRPVWYLGEALLSSGQPEKAVPAFRSALELNAGSAEAQLGLARALAKSGKLDDAAVEFQKAAAKTPEALLELAAAYEAAGKKEEAAALYSKFPDDPSARERAGELLLATGKAADAIPDLEAAVKQSPTSANRYALATAYNLAKQYDKAEPLFAAVLQSDPNNVALRANYARVLRAERKYAPAAQEFARVAQAKPDSAEAWSDLAGMLILLGQDDQAIAALDRVRALGGETAAHYYFRAIVLDKHRMYEPALASYEKFLSTSEGKNPDEEFKARQRVRIIRRELTKR